MIANKRVTDIETAYKVCYTSYNIFIFKTKTIKTKKKQNNKSE